MICFGEILTVLIVNVDYSQKWEFRVQEGNQWMILNIENLKKF
jgi:hypothetical protein